MLSNIILKISFLSNENNRIQWVKKQLLNIKKGESVLDVGAGETQYKKYCQHLKYTSQDFNQYNGVGDKVGLQTGVWNTKEIDIVSDILNIPINNSSFDNVLCTEVLEHVPYPDLAVKEISRILKKNGRLILSAPFASQTHFSPYFYSTGFSSYWYTKILVENKFKILKIDSNGNFFDYINQELCRLPVTFKKYSSLGFLSYFFYLIIIPIVMIIWLTSKLTLGSEKQLCFGYHVLATKL